MHLSALLSLVLVSPLVMGPTLAPQDKKPADAAKSKAAPAKGGAGRTIEITAGDDMKFSTTTITAKPGEQVRLVLKNIGKMPKQVMGHNVVVLKASANADAFATAAMSAQATGYIPADKKADIVASTELAGPGESVEVVFKAPAAGSYPFLCSFPGHAAAGMKGKLEVK
jgi:azurin